MESSSNNQDDIFESDVRELSRETETLSIQDTPTTSPKICVSYSKHGHCRFGRNCKFAHRQKKSEPNEFIHNKYLKHEYGRTKNVRKEIEISSRKGTVNGKQPNLSFANDSHRDNLLKRPCRYFQAGYCSKDETCNFSHSTENFNFLLSQSHKSNSVKLASYSRTKKKSVPICYFFKRGSCCKGDDCKYYHQQRFSVRLNSSLTLHQIGSLEKTNSFSNEVVTMSHNTLSKENLPCANGFNDVTTDVIPGESTCQNAHFSGNKHPLNSSDYSIECSISPRDSSNLTADVIPLKICNENSHTLNESDFCNVSSIYLLPKVENKNPSMALKIFDLPLSEQEILQLRETEVTQLRKRYPVLEVNTENTVFTFKFSPSDPDWSHDVTNFQLQTMFPENYPVEVCRINVLQSTDIISEIILRHLDENIFDWLNQRHAQSMQVNKVELLFRPFLRWFDKNLEELFCSGLQKVKQDVFDDTGDSETSDERPFLSGETDVADDFEIFQNDASLPENQDNTKSQVQQMSETYQTNSSEPIKSAVPTYAAQKFGVNILFMGLELIEGVAALSCTKLAIMLHCARCKTSSNIKTVPNKNNSVTCSKCSKSMQCNFNPSILHQFTNILGTVYLVECIGVDVNLVECAFLVDCLSCSKQVSIQGIHYGPKQKFWCMFCNQKLVLSIESSKFQSSSVTYTTVKTVPVKKIEKKKDSSIKEGGPLPQLGACKHYKKSNRWFRFPCCGRVYPCDLCHEEKESDHEMKFASRMICGFCSKEQLYSKDKPCSGCSSNVIAKPGTYWEGGKGCRNKIKMARDDKKKYAGSSKTVSKKSQNSGKKKK